MKVLAKSLAGHDKDCVYAVLKEEAAFVYVADGVLRRAENPKKKNRKHVQLISRLPKEVATLLAKEPPGDLEIKRALKLYQADRKKQEEICQKQM